MSIKFPKLFQKTLLAERSLCHAIFSVSGYILIFYFAGKTQITKSVEKSFYGFTQQLYSRVSERSRFEPVEPPADFNRVHCQQHLPGLERELALNPSNVQVDQEDKEQGQVIYISKASNAIHMII